MGKRSIFAKIFKPKYAYSLPDSKVFVEKNTLNSNDGFSNKGKKFLIIVGVFYGVVFFCLFSWLYVLHNLWSNSVYYAKHTPNTKVAAPEIIMLIDNLESMYRPEVSGINYDFDGSNTIMNCVVPDAKACVYLGEYDEGYHYYISDYEFYTLDYNLNLVRTSDWNKLIDGKPSKIPNNQVNIGKLNRDIYRAAMPVLEVNRKEPNLNLQWIFDWYYHDRFN